MKNNNELGFELMSLFLMIIILFTGIFAETDSKARQLAKYEPDQKFTSVDLLSY